MLALAYLGVELYVASHLSTPFRGPDARTPADNDLDYQTVTVQSTDGLDLEGWWVPKSDSSQAVILVPGFSANKSSPYVLKTASIYAQADYSVLMLDTRAQGRSEAEHITLGYQEIHDIRGALRWLHAEQKLRPSEVVLHGWSMGGASVVRSAPRTGVAAVVEDSGYADLPLLLRRALSEASGLPPFFNPGIILAAKLFLGFNPWAVRPEEDAHKLSEESPSLDSLTDPAPHLAQHLLNTVPAGWRAGALDSRGHSLGHVVDILLRTRERFGALRHQPSQSSGDLITPPNMSACPRHAGDPPPRGQHPVLAQDPTVYQRRRPAFDAFSVSRRTRV